MGGYLIAGGRLLDGTGAAPQDGVSVLVEGNRVRKIGPDREVAAAAETLGGYRTIDAAGRTVMPGMIDGHCHISYGDILSFEELDLYAGVEYRTLRAANNARKVLRAGVTAFSDPGSTWNISVARSRRRQRRSDRGAAHGLGRALHSPPTTRSARPGPRGWSTQNRRSPCFATRGTRWSRRRAARSRTVSIS